MVPCGLCSQVSPVIGRGIFEGHSLISDRSEIRCSRQIAQRQDALFSKSNGIKKRVRRFARIDWEMRLVAPSIKIKRPVTDV